MKCYPIRWDLTIYQLEAEQAKERFPLTYKKCFNLRSHNPSLGDPASSLVHRLVSCSNIISLLHITVVL